MNKCLRVIFDAQVPEKGLYEFIQKAAKQFNLEGTVQHVPVDKKIRIIVCGDKDGVDQFIDSLHKGADKVSLDSIEIEPFLKDKDYRGVFRVIE
ncbi:MAG: acylphosphatase [Candidatus Babeliales bacterium]|nr:acylphosphatase [Candidatus Babeliales bacterium]